jgi:fimbrial chaperone protein
MTPLKQLYFLVKKSSSIIMALLLIMAQAQASVTLVGTRVIYPADAKFVNLNFRSPDQVPSIMEVWASLQDTPSSSSQNADAPFVVMPQVFRIDPMQGQVAKLTFTGADLPQDRESLFYLNFVQLPATKSDLQSKNKLLVSYKSTVKVFYRPKSLKSDPNKALSQLKIDAGKLSAGTIKVINPTEYHITVNSIEFKQQGQRLLTLPAKTVPMIAPFSEQHISVKPTKINLAASIATLQIINDLGGISTVDIKL